jgi:hypothetical protein
MRWARTWVGRHSEVTKDERKGDAPRATVWPAPTAGRRSGRAVVGGRIPGFANAATGRWARWRRSG